MYRYYLFLCLLGILACFLSDIDAREVIVGGQVAHFRNFRYQATIFLAGRAPECGGGIMNRQYIITAARCVIGKDRKLLSKPIFVLVGTVDLRVAGAVVEVGRIFLSHDYAPTLSNPVSDIAMLKLKEELDFHRYDLKQAFSPTLDHTFYDNKIAKIAGFGWDKMFENMIIGENTDNRLRFAEAVVRNKSQCQHEHPGIIIARKHLCARVTPAPNHVGRYGACFGDTGSPLVDHNNTLIGILSITRNDCSEATSSGIYTSVARHRSFIKMALNNELSRNIFDIHL